MMKVAIALSLVVLAMVVSLRQKLNLERELVISVVRALIQMLIISLVIQFVFAQLAWSGVFLLVMLAVATWTSAGRMESLPGRFSLAAIAIGTAAGTALVLLFGGRAFPLEPRYVIPIGGMLIGNSMSTVSLAAARMRDEVVSQRTEIEARLALGVTGQEALRPYVRKAALNALVPMIDATKNVGLVTLPGAFVGMILGGAEPRAAAQVQLVVMFMLLGAVAVAAATLTWLLTHRLIDERERLIPLDR
jgi:putative ABC transport system permease protein